MFTKFVIITLLFVILYCLASALYYMLSQKHNPTAMAKALTWRIVLSVGVFLLLILGFGMGWIQPHSMG